MGTYWLDAGDSSTVASGTPDRQPWFATAGRPGGLAPAGRGSRRLRAASMASAMAGSGRTCSAAPSSIASRGMPKTTQVASSCAMVRAPAWRILSSPCAPSAPMPVSSTPTASRAGGFGHGGEQHVHRRTLVADPRTGLDADVVAAAASGAAACENRRARPARGRCAARRRLRPPSLPWRRFRSAAWQRRGRTPAECAARSRFRDRIGGSRVSTAGDRFGAAGGGADREHGPGGSAGAARRGRRGAVRPRAWRRRVPAGARGPPRRRGLCAARLWRSSPTEYGPPGLASTSTAPNSSACTAARQDGCARELMTITGSGWKCISFFRNVRPSMRGISMSSVSTSGCSARILSRAT